MKNLGSILLLCFAFSIGNAQEVTVQSNHDQNADFTQYKTFTIVDRDDPNSQWNKGERSDMERSGTDARRQRTTGVTGGEGTTERDQRTQGTTTQDGERPGGTIGTTEGNRGVHTPDGPQGTGIQDQEHRDRGQGTTGTTERDQRTQGTTTQDGERPGGTIGTTEGNRGVHTPDGPQGTGIQDQEHRDRGQGTTGTQGTGVDQGTGTTDPNSPHRGTEGAINREQHTQQGQAQGQTQDHQRQGQVSGANQGATYGQGQGSDARTGMSKHGTADMNKKKKLKEAFKSEMEKQGFTYTEGADADLLVDFKVFEDEGTVNLGTPDNTYAAWGPHIGDRAQDVSINKGTVLVNMIDAEQGQLIYQAYVNMEGEGQKEEKMKEAISQIFEDFNTVRR
jgi:hypothetical protein